jgi:hypothetical protein
MCVDEFVVQLPDEGPGPRVYFTEARAAARQYLGSKQNGMYTLSLASILLNNAEGCL